MRSYWTFQQHWTKKKKKTFGYLRTVTKLFWGKGELGGRLTTLQSFWSLTKSIRTSDFQSNQSSDISTISNASLFLVLKTAHSRHSMITSKRLLRLRECFLRDAGECYVIWVVWDAILHDLTDLLGVAISRDKLDLCGRWGAPTCKWAQHTRGCYAMTRGGYIWVLRNDFAHLGPTQCYITRSTST